MSKTLSSSVKAQMSWGFTNPDPILGDTTNSNSFTYSQTFTNGTAVNQCDLMYVTQGTITPSGSLNVDLAGSVSDFFGATISFARIKTMMVWVTTDTTGSSVLVGNGTNPFLNWVGAAAHTVRVRNGGVLLLCAPDATGYVVTSGTGDIVKLLNEDGVNTITHKTGFFGASA